MPKDSLRRAEGLAVAVIHTLERNGITVTAAARERVTSCTEPERILGWLDKSIAASTVDSLFEDPAEICRIAVSGTEDLARWETELDVGDGWAAPVTTTDRHRSSRAPAPRPSR
ncbi:hypothetical protein [Nocardia sp. NPDC059228]|uniref:hypothetical protein n=1 Tax=Nocardia sp. NPDC059228 TaxID=3346777 RepID=UPI0036B40BD5